jgi:hypothetical protein
MRALRLSAWKILAVLLAATLPSVAFAAGPFALPTVPLATPQCGIFDADCSLSVAQLSTAFGSFSMTAQGDLNGVLPAPAANGWCMPLTGTMALTFGSSADRLVLAANPASNTLCYTQAADAAGAPSPLSGPWPLRLTFAVDPVASTGLYAGAHGSGSLDGTWSTTVPCSDADGNPVQTCGLSGEPLAAFTLQSVSIPDLEIVTGGGGGGGGCVVSCGPGGGTIPGATPELDSVALFGSGLASLGGYLLLRRRARR